MKTVGYITTTLAWLVYGVTMNGWALSKLWAWFVVKTFDAPPLTIPAAIGMALIVNYLTIKLDAEKDKKPWSKTLLEGAIISTVKPLAALGFGAIVKLWMP